MEALKVAVNVSARNFTRGDIVAVVKDELAQAQLPGNALDLEITERALLADAEGTVSALERLKALGVSLTLDDFGTGYSALGYLSRFHVDAIKLDKSLVSGAQGARTAEAVTSALVALGRRLDLRVVAEGVETEEQLAWLRELGCHLVQGFLLSEPLDADAVASLVSASRTSWLKFRTLRPVAR
jgi:EAL domain-containing protein (putative c-di-GMP-specific phosphodiesterase class I)